MSYEQLPDDLYLPTAEEIVLASLDQLKEWYSKTKPYYTKRFHLTHTDYIRILIHNTMFMQIQFLEGKRKWGIS